jgi:GNAT superfamily N-acetyltransferase
LPDYSSVQQVESRNDECAYITFTFAGAIVISPAAGTFPAFAALALGSRLPSDFSENAVPMVDQTTGDAPGSPDCATLVRALYPVRARLRDGTLITIRPIEPRDAQREQAFVQSLSPESRYFRFMSTLRELSPETLYRFTHPDFCREVALVALSEAADELHQVGVARCVAVDTGRQAEFAVVVADDWQGRGVAKRLLYELMRAARAIGIKQIWGDVLTANHRMLALMRTLGFAIVRVPEDALLRRAVKTIEPEPAGQKGLSHAT